MKKNIFTRYFLLILMVILFSIIFVGSFLLIVSNNIYKDEKSKEMELNVQEIVQKTQINYYAGYEFDSIIMKNLYKSSNITSNGTQYFLFNEDGSYMDILSKKDMQYFNNKTDIRLSGAIINDINKNENFKIGDMNGMFNKILACYMTKFEIADNGSYYIIATKPVDDLNSFSLKLFIDFATCITVAIILLSIFINYMTRQMIKPIEEMTRIAKQFGEGNFSQKIEVDGEDEIASLAMTLNEMASSIAANENIRKSFVANVSHELRTPMTTIGGFVDGILDGTIPKEQHNHYMELVSEEIKRLSRLVRSMLNISKFESGEMSINYSKINLTQIIIKTVLMFEKRIEAKNVNVEGLDCDNVIIDGDEDLLQQVFYNLTENSVKFINKNGTLTFGIEIADNKNVMISFCNTGEGLNDDELPRIFDRFYKTDESRGYDKTGVGLGLSIVRSIVKLHNGRIIVKSIKGEYTEFIVELPIDKDNGL